VIDKYAFDLSPAVWRKSTRSSGSRECVEVAFIDCGLVGVRDSNEWSAFTTGVIDGEFTPSS